MSVWLISTTLRGGGWSDQIYLYLLFIQLFLFSLQHWSLSSFFFSFFLCFYSQWYQPFFFLFLNFFFYSQRHQPNLVLYLDINKKITEQLYAHHSLSHPAFWNSYLHHSLNVSIMSEQSRASIKANKSKASFIKSFAKFCFFIYILRVIFKSFDFTWKKKHFVYCLSYLINNPVSLNCFIELR